LSGRLVRRDAEDVKKGAVEAADITTSLFFFCVITGLFCVLFVISLSSVETLPLFVAALANPHYAISRHLMDAGYIVPFSYTTIDVCLRNQCDDMTPHQTTAD
jgi:hypothetical protein